MKREEWERTSHLVILIFETHSERHPELLRWVWRRRGRKKHGSIDTTL
jgi:hypothetical protein